GHPPALLADARRHHRHPGGEVAHDLPLKHRVEWHERLTLILPRGVGHKPEARAKDGTSLRHTPEARAKATFARASGVCRKVGPSLALQACVRPAHGEHSFRHLTGTPAQAISPHHVKISCCTFPATSVRRKSRPA